MRKMNRLAALLAILMMSSTMAATTYADEQAATTATNNKGSITVQNTVSGADYTVYKIFDATINGDGGVSYTIPDGVTYDGITEYFILSTNGGKTYVQLKSRVDNAKLFNWLKNKGEKVGETEEGTGSNLKFDDLDYGYYYIKSSVEGGAATMISSATPDAFVQEKNGNPTWGDGSKTTDAETYSIGDTINYMVTYKNALNFYTTEADGISTAHKIYQYVLDDTMPEAVTLKTDLGSFKVYVNDEPVTVGKTAHGKDAVVTFDENNNFKVTIPWAESKDPKTNGTEEDFYYDDVPATIKVTYQGILTKDATLGSTISEDDQKNTNRATINPNETETDEGKKYEVYSGKITIDKVEAGNTTKKLEGAKFKVINQANKNGAQYLVYTADANDGNGAFSWGTEAEGTVYTTDANGTVAISGLAAGTYYLLEIEAPQGYNVLTDAQPVTLTKGVHEEKGDLLLVTSQVANNKGTILPSTGGMGTVAFTVVGLIVMAGAAITLIIKKRA